MVNSELLINSKHQTPEANNNALTSGTTNTSRQNEAGTPCITGKKLIAKR
jgi:hypothetical protein